jgi:uncharacterized protein with HEPN domain
LPSRRPRTRLQDIVFNVEAIRRYTKGLNKQTFARNDLVVDAVERCLGRISEAAKKLGPQAEILAPDQPWREIRSLGNLLRHEYDTIRRDDLWAIVKRDLSSLHKACTKAITALEHGRD